MKWIVFSILILLNFSCSKEQTNTQIEALLFQTKFETFVTHNSFGNYTPRGVGGGGAMSSLSFSPYANLWFVGTDMGTVFRSTDYGANWYPIDHAQLKFSPKIEDAVNLGFSSNPKIIYFAEGGIDLYRSDDAGINWQKLSVELYKNEKLKYFRGDSLHPEVMYAGTNSRLLRTTNYGKTWNTLISTQGDAVGTFLDYLKHGTVIYHATKKGILKSTDNGESFTDFFVPENVEINSFTGGRDQNGLTMAFVDRNGYQACGEIEQYRKDYNSARMNNHYDHCGYIWLSKDGNGFYQTEKAAGDFVQMAENNSKDIYAAGSKYWIRQYGTKIWHSTDGGNTWPLVLHQYNWDTGEFTAWDEKKLERSAIALDVGWDDDGYQSFAVNLRNSTIVGETGFYFLFTSTDGGNYWSAPFTRYADEGRPTEFKKWSSSGLEVTSVYRMRFNPSNPQKVFAGMADVKGERSEDGGKTFSIIHSDFNSLYDFAFDRDNENIVYAAAGMQHDFPTDGWKSPTNTAGSILYSEDNGKNFKSLISKNSLFYRQYISLAFDQDAKILYAGTQGGGIVRSINKGQSFEFINAGLPYGDKIISQVEVDPKNGDVYILLTGNMYNLNNGRDFLNQKITGIYKKTREGNSWELLRGTINRPAELEKAKEFKPWLFPTSFAVDFSSDSDRMTMYLTDYEQLGLFLHSGIWKSIDGGQTWNRVLQFTHPFQIIIDPNNSKNLYVAGFHDTSELWGNGGFYTSHDSGETWSRNTDVPYSYNGLSVSLDPNDPESIFYTFLGSGIVHGPRP